MTRFISYLHRTNALTTADDLVLLHALWKRMLNPTYCAVDSVLTAHHKRRSYSWSDSVFLIFKPLSSHFRSCFFKRPGCDICPANSVAVCHLVARTLKIFTAVEPAVFPLGNGFSLPRHLLPLSLSIGPSLSISSPPRC